jgi:hypothetical protein
LNALLFEGELLLELLGLIDPIGFFGFPPPEGLVVILGKDYAGRVLLRLLLKGGDLVGG